MTYDTFNVIGDVIADGAAQDGSGLRQRRSPDCFGSAGHHCYEHLLTGPAGR